MLIKNGFLIDPASDTERLVDLRITDGLIQTLADAGTLTPENGEDELDAAGLMISPGLVDTHISVIPDLLIKKISIPDLLQLLPVDLLP